MAYAPLDYGALIAGARRGLVDASDVLEVLPDDWASREQVDKFADTWTKTNDEAGHLLEVIGTSLARGTMSDAESILASLGTVDPKINDSGTVTAAGALYLASRAAAATNQRAADGRLSSECRHRHLGIDGGGLLGAIHGTDWLGELSQVQDVDYLRKLAQRLLAPPETSPLATPSARPSEIRSRLQAVLDRDDNAVRIGEFPDGREYKLVSHEILDDMARVRRARLVLEDGQTVMVDRVHNSPSRYSKPDSAAATTPMSAPSPIEARALMAESDGEKGQLGGLITLSTRDIQTSAAFYACILGRNIKIDDGQARITTWLILKQADRPYEDRADQLVITLTRTQSD